MNCLSVDDAEPLWPFLTLPDDDAVVDLETTGLLDDPGAPAMLTIGVAVVSKGQVANRLECRARFHKPIHQGATIT